MAGKSKEELLAMGKATQFETGSKQAEIARKGGIASGKKKAEMRILREEILKRMKAEDWSEIVDGVISRAKDDDNSYKTFEATLGQKPIDRVQTIEPPKFVIDEPEDN